jgi:SSS family transporter
MVIIYCAAQLTATGKAFNSFYNMNIIAAELLGLFIVLLYVSFGGFRAVAVSDLIQGALMFMGLVLVPVVGIIKAGGIRQVFEKVSTSTPEILNVLPTNSTALAISFTVIGLMATGLGFLGSPQIYQRIIALNRKEDIKKGRLVAITYTLITDTCAVLTGVVGRYFFTSLSDPETVYPDLVQHLFGPLMIGVLIAVVLSAIMSTMDSLLILASTTIVRDYMQKILGRVTNDKTAVTYLRVSSSVIALAAFALAATKTRVVFWMVLFAWAGIASAFCPTLIMTLFWKGTNKYGVAIGAIGGFLTTVIWGVFWRDIIYEMFPGFVAGFVLIYLGSLATRGFCKQLNGKC